LIAACRIEDETIFMVDVQTMHGFQRTNRSPVWCGMLIARFKVSLNRPIRGLPHLQGQVTTACSMKTANSAACTNLAVQKADARK